MKWLSNAKPVSPIKKETSSTSKSEAYYGVGHGLDGAHGVFRSWGEVASLLMGVSICDPRKEKRRKLRISVESNLA
jgi:hypothetical protein